jgi:hypothetical protein
MKSLIRIVALALVLSIPKASFGQDEIDKFLEESVPDGTKLISAYADPLMKSLTLGLNQGWYNTAKPHKIAGIDLTITVNAMKVPESENSFNVSKLNLTSIELAPSSPGYPNAPTITGKEDAPIFRLKSDPSATFEGPPGLDLKENLKRNIIPVPMAHLGIGLPKNTDLKIRFTPSIDLGDGGSVKIFGIGVMHDIKQWIPGIKLLPFDLSGFVGFTKFTMETELDATSGSNQRAIFEMNATTIQALISKKVSVLTVYGGIGYNNAKSNLALKGLYDINDDGDTADAYERDPVALDFAANGMRLTAGMRLKLAVFTFHADYTLQKYNCFSAGFGISVR